MGNLSSVSNVNNSNFQSNDNSKNINNLEYQTNYFQRDDNKSNYQNRNQNYFYPNSHIENLMHYNKLERELYENNLDIDEDDNFEIKTYSGQTGSSINEMGKCVINKTILEVLKESKQKKSNKKISEIEEKEKNKKCHSNKNENIDAIKFVNEYFKNENVILNNNEIDFKEISKNKNSGKVLEKNKKAEKESSNNKQNNLISVKIDNEKNSLENSEHDDESSSYENYNSSEDEVSENFENKLNNENCKNCIDLFAGNQELFKDIEENFLEFKKLKEVRFDSQDESGWKPEMNTESNELNNNESDKNFQIIDLISKNSNKNSKSSYKSDINNKINELNSFKEILFKIRYDNNKNLNIKLVNYLNSFSSIQLEDLKELLLPENLDHEKIVLLHSKIEDCIESLVSTLHSYKRKKEVKLTKFIDILI